MTALFKLFFINISHFSNDNFTDHIDDLKNIIKFLFGEKYNNKNILKYFYKFLISSYQNILKNIIDIDYNLIEINNNIEIIYYEILFIILLYYTKFENNNILYNINSFVIKYPSFINSNELNELLVFSNWMKIALQVIPGYKNKGKLLNIVTAICEGNTKKYITGSGQTLCTLNRVIIYESEGKVKKTQRLKARLKSNKNKNKNLKKYKYYKTNNLVKYKKKKL